MCIISLHAVCPLYSWPHPAGTVSARESSFLIHRRKHPLLWVCFGEPSWRSYKHILCPPQSSTHLSPPHISLSLISQSCPFQVPDHFNKPVAISLKPKSVFSSVRLSSQTKILLDILPTRRTFCPHCPSEPCLLDRNATVPLAGWCLHIMENHL